MSTTAVEDEVAETLQDVVERLGGIELRRIRWNPRPGTATESDLLAANEAKHGLYELIDGVLVEKPMGYYESRLEFFLAYFLMQYLEKNDHGFLLPGTGPIRLRSSLVRLPDVSFFSWNHFPRRKLPPGGILDCGPDLAVEVVSPGNTKAEMKRKVSEYFAAGAQLVWIAEPRKRQVQVYTSPESFEVVNEDQFLTGGNVLPGFSLSVRDWLARAGDRSE